MAKHLAPARPLKWSYKKVAFADIDRFYRDYTVHAALFTDYPTETINRTESMGFGYTLARLPDSFAPFKYFLGTLQK